MTNITDPIADLLTRIRNHSVLGKPTVNIPHSQTKEAICRILHQQGYLKEVKVDDSVKPQSQLILTLNYQDDLPTITKITRISKPGRRVYAKAKDFKPVLSGYGITIVSTSKGIMTAKDARKQKLGGELICQVW